MQRLLPDSSQPHETEPVDEIAELRNEIADLRENMEKFRATIARDREQLGAMLHGLRSIFSDGTAPASVQTPAPGVDYQPPSREKWGAWKQQLPSGCGRIIEALLIQPLTQTQMIQLCKMHRTTVSANMTILRRNSLIEQDGKFWRLKRL